MTKLKKLVKKTEKIRYKSIELILKKLTPSLYKNIKIKGIVINEHFISKVPRPSVKIMKKRFNNKLVKGAEIGVQKGKNSESILKELNVETLYLIDVWCNYSKYKTAVKENYDIVLNKFKNDKRVKIIKEFSTIAAKIILDDSLDFVYIDANHTYEYVFKDIEIWTSKVKKGGIIAGHDVFNLPEVLKAVKDFCYDNKIYFYVELPDWWFIK